MKTSLSLLGLIALSTSSLIACGDGSNDDGGNGGVPSVGGTSNGDGGGTASGGSGTGGMGGSNGAAQIFSGSGTWIDGSANAYGIQGAFFILEDSVEDGMVVDDGLEHTEFAATTGDNGEEPSEFTEDTEKPCISGTVAQVTTVDGEDCDPAGDDCEWDSQWGGGIGLNLNETGGDDSMQDVFDLEAAGITGFEFTLSGDAGGAELRFKIVDDSNPDEDFCTTVSAGESVQVDLAEIEHMCWGSDGTITPDLTQISQVQWQVVSDAAASFEVDNLCVERVAVY